MIETVVLATILGTAMWLVRSRWHVVADVWRSACWWERCVLLVACAPVPGPLEEMAGLIVARRVAGRARR
jgi:hypothetical protein